MAKPSGKQADATEVFSAIVTDTVVDITTETNHHIHSIILDDATGVKTYLQMFKLQAADVVLGTTVPDYVISVNASGTGGAVYPIPFQFTVGCSIACTTTDVGLTASASRVSITYVSGSDPS